MVFPIAFHPQYLEYLLKRDVTKLYITVAIRNLAMGMVAIFSPIYIYLYFGKSIPLTLLFFGVMFGLHGMFVVLGGKAVAKIGTTKAMLLSTLFYIVYYFSLLFLAASPLFVPIAIVAAAIGMALFWPAFHIDFTRFSSQDNRGREASRINVATLFPTVLSPAIGGLILAALGFPALFVIVAVLLLASSIPLLYTREHQEVYTDSYEKAWGRIFKKENRKTSIGLFSEGTELLINFYIWPLFLFTLAISFTKMGGITSFALVASSLFMLYAGRISDTKDRPWLLNVGAVWTSMAWVLKYFVTGTFDALLAQTIYGISRAAARVPFWTFFYEKAAAKGSEADEFIVYREIVVNIGRFFFFGLLALVFFLFPQISIQTVFFVAALFSLGFVFLGNPPTLSFGSKKV
ncbi:MFS transporter [Patescibacteria group bacterium]|nr:MFS transporter [Patescibacteria group bacterium]